VKELVRELMHPGLITCRTDTTLGQVALILTQQHVHALIVTDRDSRPVGILSDFDLLAGEWLSTDASSLDAMRKMTAGEMMTSPVDTIDAGEEACAAAERMRRDGFHRLLVTERGKAVGVVSISDFVASLAAQAPSQREKVADVMSRAILACREETPVPAIARTMTEAHFRSVIVLDAAGRTKGVVSGWDLLACCEDESCAGKTASQIMHAPLTIRPDATLREAADRMIEHHYHRLVVIDPERPESVPLGVISSYDIVNEMARPGSPWLA